MAKFEILIPPVEAQGINIRLRLNADTWMNALKVGVDKLQLGTNVHDVIVEMNEDESIVVTEPQSNRVFWIRQLADLGAGAPPPRQAPQSPPPAAFPAAPVLTPPTSTPPGAPVAGAPLSGAPPAPSQAALVAKLLAAQPPLSQSQPPRAFQSPAPPASQSAPPPFLTPSPAGRTAGGAGTVMPPVPEMPPLAAPLAKPSAAADPILREPARVAPPPPPPDEPVASPAAQQRDRRMAQAFFRATEICAQTTNPNDALRAFIELTVELLPADGAALFAAQITDQDLVLVSALGGAGQVGQRCAMGEGIVGHAVLYDVPLHVAPVWSDVRFVPGSLESLGLTPRAMLAAPIQKDGRVFGALALLRLQQPFADDELETLAYLGAKLGDFLERSYLAAA